MGIIRQLPEEVSNLISAGEVIERPLSVVKELVENAIDAGSKRIEVFIKDGGKSYISVRDDGSGMDKEDLENCIKKYATSKISSKEDLYRISTLGFRGEALYSISSVSKLRITSGRENDVRCWQIMAENGTAKSIIEIGYRKGTLIEVEDLFYNIPARKKFLKSSSWERALITKFIEEISLIYPEISFLLNADGKDILILNSVDSLNLRTKNIFPRFADNIISGSKQEDFYGLKVHISKSRQDMADFYVYAVNKRLVREKVIMKAVADSFASQSQKPSFIFIDLMVPAFDIDVNVHPSKREIKFKNSEKVYKLVRATIEETLKEKSYIKIDEIKVSRIGEERKDYINSSAAEESEQVTLFSEFSEHFKESFRVIGVFSRCYLLIEWKDDLYIIDQHAVHERLIYNRLLKSFNSGGTKKMIMPYIFNVSESLKDKLLEQRESFEKLGFLYEEVGPKTFALTDIPEAADIDSAVAAFSELIRDQPLFIGKDILRKIAAKIACKEAVKKGDILSREEIEKLINDYRENKTEAFCPHGRNFILKITVNDLEKLFSRKL